MATDYVTSPVTNKGKIYFGLILGVLTFLFRMFGPNAEGVAYSIIIANLLTPFLDMASVPKPFGWNKPEKKRRLIGNEQTDKRCTPSARSYCSSRSSSRCCI